MGPAICMFPLPSVCVQRNQGLSRRTRFSASCGLLAWMMRSATFKVTLVNVWIFPAVRSWLELIREKVRASLFHSSFILSSTIWGYKRQCLSSPGFDLFTSFLHSPQAGYVSGMLAPVGISISGALLIVGALYGIRTIHRKRRNNLKDQRKKTRQQVRPFKVCFSLTIGRLWRIFLLPSKPEKRGAAVRTKPCCSPTAPKMSSDPLDLLFCQRPIPYRRLCKRKRKIPIAMTTVSTHPRLFGYDSSDTQSVTVAIQRSSLCVFPPIFLITSMWALFPVLSGGVTAGLVWRLHAIVEKWSCTAMHSQGCQPGGMQCLQSPGSGFSTEHLKRADGELHSPTIIM